MSRFMRNFVVSFGITLLLFSGIGMVSSNANEDPGAGTGVFCKFSPICQNNIPCPLSLLGQVCSWKPPIAPDPNDPHLVDCRC
jgi:hypothetical protein